jgi:hypothetical protein
MDDMEYELFEGDAMPGYGGGASYGYDPLGNKTPGIDWDHMGNQRTAIHEARNAVKWGNADETQKQMVHDENVAGCMGCLLLILVIILFLAVVTVFTMLTGQFNWDYLFSLFS